MGRRRRAVRRTIGVDPKYNSELVGRLISMLMQRGKGSKLTALGEKLVWADRRIAAAYEDLTLEFMPALLPGVASASIATREAAGWMRSDSRSKSRPSWTPAAPGPCTWDPRRAC